MKFTHPPESTPLDGFTIKRAIQRGGFGEVYYALSDAGKEVALKLLKHNLEIELRGVKQCLNLKHENLVTIFDVRTDEDGDHWIVMEYVSGKNLATVILETDGPMPVTEVQKWFSGITAGLSYLHDRGIVHRDLKPANVFRESDVVKIGDVGLSKFISQSRRSAQTESVGTVYYMAPEVAHGRYGREVDVYSSAVVLYELLTGRLPFDGETTGEILMKHLTEKPDLSPLPAQFRPVLARALEKDPLKRTPSVDQLEDEFNKAVLGIEIALDIPDDSFHSETVTDKRSARSLLDEAKRLGREARRAAIVARHKTRQEHKIARQQRRAARHDRKVSHPVAGGSTGVRVDVRTPPAHTRPTNIPRARRQRKSNSSGWFPIAAIGCVAAALVLPSMREGRPVGTLFLVGVCAAMGYGLFRLIGLLTVPSAFQTSAMQGQSAGNRHAAGQGPQSSLVPWIIAGLIGLILWELLAPGPVLPRMVGGLLGVGFYLGMAFGVYRLFSRMPSPRPEPSPGNETPAQPVSAVVNPSLPRRHWRKLNVETLRTIPLRYRIADLSGAMAYAALMTVIVTAGIWAFLPQTFMQGDVGTAGLFAIITLLGAWAVLVPSKLWEGGRTQTHIRRITMIAAGCLVGAAACWMQQTLMVNVDYTLWGAGGSPDETLLTSVGSYNLVGTDYQPAYAGYMVFFAALFGVRRWWRHTDAFRKRRIRIGTVMLTGLAGFVLPMLFAFPNTWGLMWALAISVVVQLSSVWVHPLNRPRLMQGSEDRA